MRIPLRFTVILVSSLLFQDCATYWKNRRNDLADVFTAGVEDPGYGGGLRLGPLAMGFVFQGGESKLGLRDLGQGYGLRGGRLGKYHSQQLIFGILGGEKFYSKHSIPKIPEELQQKPPDEEEKYKPKDEVPILPSERDNAKSIDMRYLVFYHIPIEKRAAAKKEAYRKKILEDLYSETGEENPLDAIPEKPNQKPDGYPKAFLFQTEMYLGLHYGIRVGFNVAELADFVLGWTTWDILDDDIPDKDKGEQGSAPPGAMPPGFPFPQ